MKYYIDKRIYSLSKNDLRTFPTYYRGNSVEGMEYGTYDTFEEAKAAISKLRTEVEYLGGDKWKVTEFYVNGYEEDEDIFEDALLATPWNGWKIDDGYGETVETGFELYRDADDRIWHMKLEYDEESDMPDPRDFEIIYNEGK